MNRWWIYQRERFPLFSHGLLILTFSTAAVCFSALLRNAHPFPMWKALLVAFVASFISFLHLRIADEFKDYEEDLRHRPYRPVQRGLVKLSELRWIWIGSAIIQFILALWLHPLLIIPLLIIWIYLTLMTQEFFCRSWLKRHPFTYLWTHMLIMPLIDLFATACDWIPAQGLQAPGGLFWFLAASFFNGFVLDLGRKIRAPENEESGVQTYSVLWGRQRAVTAWWISIALTGGSACLAALHINWLFPVAIPFAVMLVFAVLAGVTFLRKPTAAASLNLERFSGVCTLILYFVLGILPALWWKMN
jgi:4-hydroxybenzoate polyprenyltransferase